MVFESFRILTLTQNVFCPMQLWPISGTEMCYSPVLSSKYWQVPVAHTHQGLAQWHPWDRAGCRQLTSCYRPPCVFTFCPQIGFFPVSQCSCQTLNMQLRLLTFSSVGCQTNPLTKFAALISCATLSEEHEVSLPSWWLLPAFALGGISVSFQYTYKPISATLMWSVNWLMNNLWNPFLRSSVNILCTSLCPH